jgi:hypothetical protein
MDDVLRMALSPEVKVEPPRPRKQKTEETEEEQ